MHGGVKFYRGSAAAARSYVETDYSRADDYYLVEGCGVAEHYAAAIDDALVIDRRPDLDGPTYERWVAGHDVDTDRPKGRLRSDDRALRFVEVVVNGPKSWSLAAGLHPDIAAAYDAAQTRAATEIIGWVAEHATTRVGPRGRQVQVPVEKLEAAVVRHYTSRAGDPHRHLHLQINARVFAAGAWRGLHSVGVVDSIEAINGIGHAAVMCDREFRAALARNGYTLNEDGEVRELAPHVGGFSQRASQITRNVDRYEARWRADHPGEEPGPRLRRSWDRRAWAQARPDKAVPQNGSELVTRWNDELRQLGFSPPSTPSAAASTPIGSLDRDAIATLAVSRLGARRSAWNAADLRGEAERLITQTGVVAERQIRVELAEDVTARAVGRCRPLLDRLDVPDHVRSLTSTQVLAVEDDITTRLAARAETPACAVRVGPVIARRQLDHAQRAVAAAIAGSGDLLVIEGAAGAGKTTTLATARSLLEMQDRRLVVVTPTLKAAQVAEQQVGTDAFSAAWLIHKHGFRWDQDGHWTRQPASPSAAARLLPGDVLLVDEAGMLDQDTARALLTVADEAGARVAFIGDRHQLPAVGRGGVLDLAARWAAPEARLALETVHRFTDPGYAELSLLMRTGQRAGEVFDALLERGEILIHATEVERTAAITSADGLVVADTREQVATLNATIRDRHAADRAISGEPSGEPSGGPVTQRGEPVTRRGERIGVGDRVATRRNDRALGVANRDTWTVLAAAEDGGLVVSGINGQRSLPAPYVRDHVELAYATTVHGAQGDTVDRAHFVIGENTGAAAAYVAMTRGRHANTAHLVADDHDDARRQWVEAFSRDRSDLGPTHAATRAADDIERYGPRAPLRSSALHSAALSQPPRRPRDPYPTSAPAGGHGIGI